jgi:hypothetical protein
MKQFLLVGLVSASLVCAAVGCGRYEALSAEGSTVHATTTRPKGQCMELGTVTGKGGGAGGGYVSNEDLMANAMNDLRNNAAHLAATHVVYASPSMGTNDGTTTSVTVTGEALKCTDEEEDESEASTSADDEPKAAPAAVAANSGGCQNDAQCKGDRICVRNECVDPPAKAPASEAPATP